jgi:hypothetical protein
VIRVRNYLDRLKRHWRLLLGASCLLLVGWAGIRGRSEWLRVWNDQLHAAKKPATFSNIDPTFAKDPAIDGAKLKVIGPLANTMQRQRSEADSEAAADPCISFSSSAACVLFLSSEGM